MHHESLPTDNEGREIIEIGIDDESSMSDSSEEHQEYARNINDEPQDRPRIVDDGGDDELDAIIEIRNWAIGSTIPQNKLDNLLVILKRRFLPHLPKSSKTLLSTAEARFYLHEMEAADGSIG